jgi:hypothetical protein
MQAEARVGVISSAVGTVNALRANEQGSLMVQPSGGKYYEAVKLGRVYVVANQAAVALTAAFATTYTGLLISNPVGSNVNLVMMNVAFSLSVVASAATVIGLMTGANPTTAIAAGLTPRNRLIGGAAGVARASASCDLTGAVPVLEQPIAQVGTLATTGTQIGNVASLDLEGSMIVTPGGYVAIYSFAANTAVALCSFMWEEVPR